MLRPGCQTPRETLTLNPNARTVLAVNKQVVEGVRFTGYVDIKANDVVLRNCLLPAAGYFAIRQYDNFGGLRLENVTVDGALSEARTCHEAVAMSYGRASHSYQEAGRT